MNKYIVAGLVILGITLALVFNPIRTVGTGERGVKVRFGAVVGEPLNEGIHFVIPFIESVNLMDIKIQKDQVEASASSKDLQDVTTTVAVNYHLEASKVGYIYQTIGQNYKKTTLVNDRLIAPSIQESIKYSTAKYTAEELITKREDVRADIKRSLGEKMEKYGAIIDEINIVNFKFSNSFNEAIERKVTAEQDALTSKNKLQQVQFEAEQRIAEAKGKAEAIRVESAALNSNPQVLQLRAIEKWDGKLPQVTGENTPLISIK